MSISIVFNKEAVIKNMLSLAGYDAYKKYREETQESGNNGTDSNIKFIIANKILNKSIYYTPVDTGKLRNSIYIKPYEDGWEIGYTCDYAIYVHEIGVNYHKPPTQYKFLEDAAFEVINEYRADTGMELPVTMEYDPLRAFIGVANSPGESLTGIKANEQLLDKPETYDKLWNNFINYLNSDDDTWSEADKAYYDTMTEFFEYYKDYRHMNTMAILREWIDRTRHKLR